MFSLIGYPQWNIDIIVNDTGDVGTPYTVSLVSEVDGESISLDGDGDQTLTFNLSRKTNFRTFKVQLSATAATTYAIQLKMRYSWLGAGVSEVSNLYDANNGNNSPVQDLLLRDHLPDKDN